MNLALKIAILQTGKRQYEVAKELGWMDSKISRILNGSYTATEEEMKKIAILLNKSVEDLFSDGIERG